MKRGLRISDILIYGVVIAILINTSTMYRFLITSPLYGRGFGWPLGIICFLYVIQSKKIKSNYSLKVRLPILLAMFLVYAAATGYNVRSYLVGYVGVFFCMFVFSYFLYQNDEMMVFLKAFSNVILIIAVISLFCWLFGSILHILPGRTQLSFYWADHYRTAYTYGYLYFENPQQSKGYDIVRNIGIFTEAPGYSGFLTYGLLIEMVMRRIEVKKRKEQIIRILIYVITLFSTNSTKGIIAVFIMILFDFFFIKKARTQFGMNMKVCIGIAFAAVAIVLGIRLLGMKLATSSGMVRTDDMLAGLKTFVQNPVFGAGFNNSEAIINNQLVKRSSTGLSMGLTTMLAYGGAWIFSIYAGAAVVSFKNAFFRSHRIIWFLICIVLVYNLFISNAGFSDTYIFIIAAAYAAPVRKTQSVWIDNERKIGMNAAAHA